MTSRLATFWQKFSGAQRATPPALLEEPAAAPITTILPGVDIAPNDPLLAYLRQVNGPVEIARLRLDSPALTQMKATGVVVSVPLVSQGELIGLINLGDRRSEQEYSSDDRKLLADLATQSAPAVRVAQLVRQQQLQAIEQERMAQELAVAQLVQKTLLPQSLPELDGWAIAAYYQPARAVGGDFYDFRTLPDGKLAIIIGDVTDKGVPAALVMATTRTLLRAASERLGSPGAVLERVNDLLHPDIPARMFVTCLYAVLDTQTGHLLYANAGHDLPYRAGPDGVEELRARGMPLGLLPGMSYEEKETTLTPGDTLLLYSDGLVEAHDRQRGMYGFPKLRQELSEFTGGDLVAYLLTTLHDFVGPAWEQEDDVTLVTVRYEGAPQPQGGQPTQLADFTLPSAPGNERQAMTRIAEAVVSLGLPPDRLEKLKTAVAEATMNAMEHGNHYRDDLPVRIQAESDGQRLAVRITDQGGDVEIPDPATPDIALKLAGLQSPRGWGLFLIKSMVDEMNVTDDDQHHTIELVINLAQE
ncbi:MAG: GAF domain-containing protein [Chloroflexi bacterium]|nr:MAG: GAF domain-containing protein [Chloroflexota bacterium]